MRVSSNAIAAAFVARDFGPGFTVDESDHRAHSHPGGTEEEANTDRRRMERANYDAYLQRQFWRMTWRAGIRNSNDDGALSPSPSSSSSRDNRSDELLMRTQLHVAADVAGDVNGRLLATAIRDCNNDHEVTAFACFIRSYERQISSEKQSERCSGLYGIGLIDRLQRQRHAMCSPLSSSSSSLTCFSDRIAPDHSIDTAVCGATNFVVDFSKMLDGDFPWLSFQRGALLLSRCELMPAADRSKFWTFMHCLRDWMDLGLDVVTDDHNNNNNRRRVVDDAGGNRGECPAPLQPSSSSSLSGDVVLDEFFVTRSGDYSPFALAHDWVNTVILFAVANISRRAVHINLMDRMTVGFFSPMWSLAFSPGRPVSWFPDLRRPQRSDDSDNARHGCKSHAVRRGWFNIPARLSPLYNNDDCGESALLRFTSDLLLSSVGALNVVAPRNCFVVVVIVRRNYATGHSIERRIPNWRELVAALRTDLPLALLRDKKSNQQKHQQNIVSLTDVVVHAIDYADYDFDVQLNITHSADMVVGMHGAGLIQSWFLPRSGGVFEFFCPDRPPSNNRYENLARRLGLLYSSLNIDSDQNVVPVAQAVSAIRSLAKKVAAKKQIA